MFTDNNPGGIWYIFLTRNSVKICLFIYYVNINVDI